MGREATRIALLLNAGRRRCLAVLYAPRCRALIASLMPPTLPFWIAFVVTVLALAVTLVTGLTRRRRLHLVLAPFTVVSLVVTIVLTEQLVRRYEFPAAIKDTHLIFAKAGGLLVLPVVATGLWLWRREAARPWHRLAVVVWIVSVLVATGTGLWMFSHGVLRTD
jgi:hypothetical protein